MPTLFMRFWCLKLTEVLNGKNLFILKTKQDSIKALPGFIDAILFLYLIVRSLTQHARPEGACITVCLQGIPYCAEPAFSGFPHNFHINGPGLRAVKVNQVDFLGASADNLSFNNREHTVISHQHTF